MRRCSSTKLLALPLLAALLLMLLALTAVPSLGQPFPSTPPAGCSAIAGTCIRIGMFRCGPSCPIAGTDAMADWYAERIRKMGGAFAALPAVPVYFVWGPVVLPSTAAAVVQGYVKANFTGPNAATLPLVDFVILPAGSNWELGMIELEKYHIPAIAANSPFSGLYQCPFTDYLLPKYTPCKASNTRRFQYAHGIASSGESYLQPWVGLMKLKKARTLGVVRQEGVAMYPTVLTGIKTAASDLGMEVIYAKNFSLPKVVAPAVAVVTQADVMNIIHDLTFYKPDGVALLAQDCQPWLRAFAAADYAPKSLSTVSCVDTPAFATALGNKMAYVTGSAQWSTDLNGNDYVEDLDQTPWCLFPHARSGILFNDSSPMQFQALWQMLTKRSDAPGYAEGAVLIGLSMLEGAITMALSADPLLVNQQLQLYYQSSYFGLISTNRFGLNQQKQLVINQRDAANGLQIISPASSANLDFIYPMPVFSERTYVQKMFSTEIEYIVIAVLVLCSLFTLSLMGYLFMNRHNQVFQAAGLPFYLMMGLGCIMAFSSVLVWGVENNEKSCAARVWMWTLCFHMFVDPLLASSWRISRIFSQRLQTVKLTNRTVGLVCLAIVTPQLIINVLWQIIAPLEPSIVTESGQELRPAHTSFTTCSAGDNGVIFAGATLAYSGLCLVAACYLAYKVRKAYRMFNDARPIAMSMYIFTVTAAIILVIQIALNSPDVNSQKVLFGLRSIGVMAAYQSSLALLYFRRILGQTEVNKYAGKGGGIQDSLSSGDTTNSGRPTGGRAHITPVGGATNSQGKLVFNKDGTGGNASGGGGAPSSQRDGIRNVHVHIQPPAMNNSGSGPEATITSPSGQPSPGRGAVGAGKSFGATSSPGSRSAHAGPSTVGVSQLALDGLNRTPLSTGIGQRAGANRPAALTHHMHIIQIPSAIPLPSHAEMLAMDPAALATLVQQFHAQNQVLRSQIRGQNLAVAAVNRGEPGSPGLWAAGAGTDVAGRSRQTSLPGTPDRSPRFAHGQGSATPNDSRRPSTVQQINGGGASPGALSIGSGLGDNHGSAEMIALRPYGGGAALDGSAMHGGAPRVVSNDSMTQSLISGVSVDSDAAAGGAAAGSGGGGASVVSVSPAHALTTTAHGIGISMEISPVDEIGPISQDQSLTK